MAVYGVTRREDLDPRFKVIGKLRKGGPKQNGQFGKDLEWFRFTSDNDAVTKAFRQAYPDDHPASFIVRFPYPTIEAVFPTFRETYGQNGQLKEQCDGMNIVQWREGYNWKRGKMLCQKKCKDVEASPPCPDCPLKLVGRLSVMLMPLIRARIVGTITIETHSWHDALHISGELVKYEPLTGKTFRVYREKNKIGAPNKKTNKRMAVDKWLVRIEATPETEMLMIEGAQRKARLELAGPVIGAPQIEAGQPVTPDMIIEQPPIDLDQPTEGEYGEVLDEYFEDDAPFQAPPQFTSWKQLKADAIAKLGYKTEDEVTGALKSIFNGDAGSLTFEVAWTALIEHQESRLAGQEPNVDDLEF